MPTQAPSYPPSPNLLPRPYPSLIPGGSSFAVHPYRGRSKHAPARSARRVSAWRLQRTRPWRTNRRRKKEGGRRGGGAEGSHFPCPFLSNYLSMYPCPSKFLSNSTIPVIRTRVSDVCERLPRSLLASISLPSNWIWMSDKLCRFRKTGYTVWSHPISRQTNRLHQNNQKEPHKRRFSP